MLLETIDDTLSFSGAETSQVRTLTLPVGTSFRGLEFRFFGFGTGATGKLFSAINSIRIQVDGQAPLSELALLETASDVEHYTGLLLRNEISTTNIINYGDYGDVNATGSNYFLLPWQHSNSNQIRIVVDMNMSGDEFGTGATSTASMSVSFLNPGTRVTTTSVLSKESFLADTTNEQITIPQWGSDEFVIVVDNTNDVTLIQQNALNLQYNRPDDIGMLWNFITNQGLSTDGLFSRYYILPGRNFRPRAGASTVNVTKTNSATAGRIYWHQTVPVGTARGMGL